MKVLHAIHTFPPLSRAGSENYCEALASAQLRAGHEVAVVYREADAEREEYALTAVSTHAFPTYRINNTFRHCQTFEETYRNDRLAATFDRLLASFRPDVVHFHHLTCLSTTCVHRAAERSIPIVFTLHDFWLFCSRGQLMRRDMSLCERHDDADCVRCMALQLPTSGGHPQAEALFERARRLPGWLPRDLHRRMASWPFRRETAALEAIARRNAHFLETCGRVDRFVAPSRFLADRYVEFGIPRERIQVQDYGFDVTAWPERERPAKEEARLRVVYLGTWIPTKGVHLLIEAARSLDPEALVLDVYGYAPGYDGVPDYEATLRTLAGDASHVRFQGRYDPEALPEILAGADVVAVPSVWYENSPLTVHEAFLAGVPVIVAGHGGMAELVRDGVDGLTFRPGSVGSLRAALRRLADDPALLRRMAAAAPRVRSLAEDASDVQAIYESVVAGRRTAAGATA